MTNSFRFLDYDERPELSPPAAAYHLRCLELGAGVEGKEYAYGRHKLQRLTVYAAAKPTGEVLLVFHGGRFCHGYKEWMAMMAAPLRHRGITLISAGYRLIPEPFPAGLEDCAAVLRWVSDNLDACSGAKDAIFTGGHSSGGYYAAMLALRSEELRLGELPAVAGCLPISGLYLMEADKLPGPLLFPDGAEPDTYATASPIRHDLGRAPPFHITWGSKDLPPIPEQSTAMIEALRKANREVETMILDGADHFDTHYAAAETEGSWVKAADAFIKRHRVR